MRNAFDSHRRLGRNRDRLASFFFLPPRRERFDVGNQISLLLRIKSIPDGHVRIRNPTPYGIEEVLVRRQGTSRSRTTFENRSGKIAGLGVDPLCIFSVPITQVAVT